MRRWLGITLVLVVAGVGGCGQNAQQSGTKEALDGGATSAPVLSEPQEKSATQPSQPSQQAPRLSQYPSAPASDQPQEPSAEATTVSQQDGEDESANRFGVFGSLGRALVRSVTRGEPSGQAVGPTEEPAEPAEQSQTEQEEQDGSDDQEKSGQQQ